MIPENSSVVDTTMLVRSAATYVPNYEKFLLKKVNFERQYATFYETRLKMSTDMLRVQAQKKWGPSSTIKHLCDITGNEKVIVIGTVFKHMELHPSILKEISEEHNLIPQPVTEQYTNDDDYLILEDNLQQVVLSGNIDPHLHVTGINIAVSGYTEENGRFFVEDCCYPYVNDPEIAPSLSTDKYVLLLSGIGIGDSKVNFPLQILVDLITGNIGDPQKFSQIARVIIAGNSVREQAIDPFKAKFLTRKSKPSTIGNVQVFDEVMSQIASTVDVDIMPGEFDPANHLLPQQPLHPCMFPRASQFSTFHVVTNPYDATIDGVRFLGSSGQNVKDISAYCRLSDPLDVMEKTLDWGHISPTSPDSLNCYPFDNADPFILSQYPHVYFSGNASKFGFRHYGNKVLMIAVPAFCKDFCAVLLNLRNLEVNPILLK